MGERDRLVAFYQDLLGLELLMDQRWVVTLGSPATPSVQVTFLDNDRTGPERPVLSVEVNDLDRVHQRVVEAGHRIVHERTVEEWGVERFFVEDPAGNIVNVLCHADPTPRG
jgi:catechol 2,3-dioxygenase-like lactoylglutathione lyase family enzyme